MLNEICQKYKNKNIQADNISCDYLISSKALVKFVTKICNLDAYLYYKI